MKRFIAPLAAVLFIAAPLFASASTLSDLQTKLQSLLAQVSAVQAQITALQTPVPTSTTTPTGSTNALLPYCLTLTNTLSAGSTDAKTNGEVTKLQTLLAQVPALYPEGLISGYFGAATGRAVSRLQQQGGMSPVSGTVGLATRLLLSQSCGSSSGVSGTAATVSGIPSIAIDQSSLVSLVSPVTITGTAQNVKTIMFSIDSGNTISFKNDSVPVVSGMWAAITSALPNGAYKVTARSTSGNAMANGYLIVSVSASTSTPTVVTPPKKTSVQDIVIPSAPAGKSEVTVSANGSAGGATVVSGSKALIGWSAKLSSACRLSAGSLPDISPASLPVFSPGNSTGALFQTTTFTIACTGNDGNPVSGSVTVTVPLQK